MNVREVIIHRHGTSLILTPKHDTWWEDYFASGQSLSYDFPDDMSDLPFEAREEP